MSNPNYLKSTGSDGNGGTSFADSKATLVGAMAGSLAGERTWVSHAHAEPAYSSATTITMPGTLASPSEIFVGNDAVEPPSAFATGVVIATSGANALTVNGSGNVRGLSFQAGSGSSNGNLTINSTDGNSQLHENGEFVLNNTHASSILTIGGSSANSTRLKNQGLKLGSTGQHCRLGSKIRMEGVYGISGTLTPTSGLFLLGLSGNSPNFIARNSDLSNFASTLIIFRSPNAAQHHGFGLLDGVILPPSWTGSLVAAATLNPAWRVEMYNAISGSTMYYVSIDDGFGTIRDSQTIYRTGGFAIDGVPMSMKMTVGANGRWPLNRFESGQMVRHYPGTDAEEAAWVPGATKTVKVRFVHDTNVAAGQGAGTAFAFQNNQFALEVQELDSAGSVIRTTVSSAPPDIFTAATDLGSNSDPWTTTGLTTPVIQEFSVSIAPEEKGTLVGRIIGYAAGKVIYYDNEMTVS